MYRRKNHIAVYLAIFVGAALLVITYLKIRKAQRLAKSKKKGTVIVDDIVKINAAGVPVPSDFSDPSNSIFKSSPTIVKDIKSIVDVINQNTGVVGPVKQTPIDDPYQTPPVYFPTGGPKESIEQSHYIK